MSLSPKKFPNATIQFDLTFMNFPRAVTHLMKVHSERIDHNLEAYKESMAYRAWTKALDEINNKLDKKENKDTSERIKIENALDRYNPHAFYFTANINQDDDHGDKASLDLLIERTIRVAEAIQKSHTATRNLPKLYNEEINSLAQKLLEQD